MSAEHKTPAQSLKEMRETAGLTQQQMADTTGVPLWTIRAYEQGKRSIMDAKFSAVIKMAEAVGYSVLIQHVIQHAEDKNSVTTE